jgi:DNA-binding NtrC family response regulator
MPESLHPVQDFALAPAMGLPVAGPLPPLAGLRILAVEDSRFASDALRLIATRSGARFRRAETIVAARHYLGAQDPDLVLVDLGLPDGPGEGLIADCAAAGRAVVGMSGAPEGEGRALAAGALFFLQKPLPGIAAFQRLVLRAVRAKGWAPPDPSQPMPAVDPLALRDDLRRAAELLLRADPAYARGFLASVARMAGDRALALAAEGGVPRADLARMVHDRLEATAPF